MTVLTEKVIHFSKVKVVLYLTAVLTFFGFFNYKFHEMLDLAAQSELRTQLPTGYDFLYEYFYYGVLFSFSLFMLALIVLVALKRSLDRPYAFMLNQEGITIPSHKTKVSNGAIASNETVFLNKIIPWSDVLTIKRNGIVILVELSKDSKNQANTIDNLGVDLKKSTNKNIFVVGVLSLVPSRNKLVIMNLLSDTNSWELFDSMVAYYSQS